MEKRYQVFISSTFQDLQNARQEVSQALLRADCFPAGMELFPAADEEQFEFIKTVIDQSDYYVIISAGRYGSIHPETGLSYTEMEYDYAVETGKPVIRLLHKDPFNELKGEFIEPKDEGKKLLEAFRQKLTKGKMVRFWREPAELLVETVFGLQDIQTRHPAEGWVRANTASTELELENFKLKQELMKRDTLKHPVEVKLSEVLKDLQLGTVSQVISIINTQHGADKNINEALTVILEQFSRTSFLGPIEIDAISGNLGIDERSTRALLAAFTQDGYLSTDGDGDFVGESDLKRLAVKLPLIELLSP